jgi:hypothetical protein
MLDMIQVIVVLAVEVVAVVLMFQRVSMSQMTVSSRDKIVELGGRIRQVADQVL